MWYNQSALSAVLHACFDDVTQTEHFVLFLGPSGKLDNHGNMIQVIFQGGWYNCTIFWACVLLLLVNCSTHGSVVFFVFFFGKSEQSSFRTGKNQNFLAPQKSKTILCEKLQTLLSFVVRICERILNVFPFLLKIAWLLLESCSLMYNEINETIEVSQFIFVM